MVTFVAGLFGSLWKQEKCSISINEEVPYETEPGLSSDAMNESLFSNTKILQYNGTIDVMLGLSGSP